MPGFLVHIFPLSSYSFEITVGSDHKLLNVLSREGSPLISLVISFGPAVVAAYLWSRHVTSRLFVVGEDEQLHPSIFPVLKNTTT